MSSSSLSKLSYSIFLVLFCFLNACSTISLPSLEWGEEKNDPSVALRVKLEFDSSVQQAAMPYRDGCGNEQSFQFGTQLSQMLMIDSKKVFIQVIDSQAPTFTSLAEAVLQYTVLDHDYDLTIPRLESDGAYPAKAMIRIRAALKDISTGTELYAETFKGQGRWRVSSDEFGQECEPIGIGIPINSALEDISDQLVASMRESGRLQIVASQIVANRQQLDGRVSQPSSSPAAISVPIAGKVPKPAESLPSVQAVKKSSVQFRTKLVDANRNLVLEGGETLRLLIEIRNVSNSIIPSAYVELRGTHILVEAFKQVVSLPVPLGSFQIGEKRTAEIRGRLPRIKEKISGELVVGIILSKGLPPGSHSILTEIVPGVRLEK